MNNTQFRLVKKTLLQMTKILGEGVKAMWKSRYDYTPDEDSEYASVDAEQGGQKSSHSAAEEDIKPPVGRCTKI
jgi:hypothetical protein